MDGDAFFVACEVAKNPKLRGLPVVTGEERGIASALSYEAKALGIVRGMPVFKIKRDFPSVIILPGDYRSYAKYSSLMFDVVRRYADEVEEYSIDECFAELTGLHKPLGMTYRQIVERIKREINEELDLSVSIGLAPTKCLAKVASKWQKPNGLTIIEKETAKEFLTNTPIENIWGIGRKTARKLWGMGIDTAQDFAGKEKSWIEENFERPYQAIWHELNSVPVMKIDSMPKDGYSSMQRTRTFTPPSNDPLFLLSQLSKNMEEVCRKARHYSLVPKAISFFLKTQNFHYFSYSFALHTPSNSPEILFSLVHAYFKKVYKKDTMYRTTGVSLYGLTPSGASQMDLFGKTVFAGKFEKIHESLDRLEEKLGKRLVYVASTHKALEHKVKGTETEDLGRDLLFL